MPFYDKINNNSWNIKSEKIDKNKNISQVVKNFFNFILKYDKKI